MKVAFCSWNSTGGFFGRAISPLVRFYKDRGHDVHLVDYKNWTNRKLDAISNLDRVYFWNAEYDWLRSTKSWCRDNGVERYCVEVAWFPQSEKIYVDPRGTNGNSIQHFDDLSWLVEEDWDRFYALREAYREGRELTKEGYVFVPLQLAHDTAMSKWSALKRNGDVVRMAQNIFKDRKIIFRQHPKDKKPYDDLGICESLEEGNSGDLKDLICGADLVWGVNSTVLSEAALMGKDVITHGKSFLDTGPSREKALCAMVAREIPMDTTDLTPWIRGRTGLEHLAEQL